MKRLPLKTASFRYVEESFREWLEVLGYAAKTVKSMPWRVREMLYHLENKGITSLKEIDSKQIKIYFEKHLKQRASTGHKGGALESATLNNHIQSIYKFLDYLRQVGRLTIPQPNLKREEPGRRIVFLTEEEVRQLFAASYQPQERRPDLPDSRIEAMQSRDRAMLSIFYG